MPKVPKITNFQCLCNISRKVGGKYDFLHKDKQRLLQPGGIVLMVIARHAQSTQNSKFYRGNISVSLCNISKKKGEVKCNFSKQINIKLFCKVIPLTLVGMARPVVLKTRNQK